VISKPPRWNWRLAAIGAVAVGGAASFGGYGLASTPSHGTRAAKGALTRVSASGSPVRVSARTMRMLRASGGGLLSLLKTENGRNYYRIAGTSRGTCYGSGPAGVPAQLGVETCSLSPAFPSPGRPVLDFSLVEPVLGGEIARIIRIEGIAADGVDSVAWLDASGTIVTRVRVTNNVYSLTKPPAAAVAGYEAFDPSGAVLYRFAYGRS